MRSSFQLHVADSIVFFHELVRYAKSGNWVLISALHSLFSIDFAVGLAQLSAAQVRSNLPLICFQLYAACFHSNLSLVWPSSMQFALY